jgi:hypothetical protein
MHVDAAGSLISKLKTLREKMKTWKKSLQPAFRNILERKISLIHMVTITAKQIGKVTWCILRDEDSRFYHSRVSARLKCNKIKVVEQDGMRYFSHKEKEHILTDYYCGILGKTAITQYLIDLKEVHPNHSDLSTLTLPFSEEKSLVLLS